MMQRRPQFAKGGDDTRQLQIDWGSSLDGGQPGIGATPPTTTAARSVVTAPADETPAIPAPARSPLPRRRSVAACLPVPRPLPSAIAAGNFGQDEDGKPVRPGTYEIRDITERHADKLIDLLDAIAVAPANGKDALQMQFDTGIAAYAEDFGQHAAHQLEAYVRRQASFEQSERGGRSR